MFFSCVFYIRKSAELIVDRCCGLWCEIRWLSFNPPANHVFQFIILSLIWTFGAWVDFFLLGYKASSIMMPAHAAALQIIVKI